MGESGDTHESHGIGYRQCVFRKRPAPQEDHDIVGEGLRQIHRLLVNAATSPMIPARGVSPGRAVKNEQSPAGKPPPNLYSQFSAKLEAVSDREEDGFDPLVGGEFVVKSVDGASAWFGDGACTQATTPEHVVE